MMKIETIIDFAVKPKRAHYMEYKGDERKDKPIQGVNSNTCPKVSISDSFNRSGVLKVACIGHDTSSLHTNLLVNGKTGQKHCDDYGVATYPFKNELSNVDVELSNICIRRNKKPDVPKIIEKWEAQSNTKKFDPFNKGYEESNSLDQNYVRLCVQAHFNDGSKSNIKISDPIFNGPPDIKIERWPENVEFDVNGNKEIYLLVRQLSSDQRNVKARIKNSNETQFEKSVLDLIHNHHDYTLVFKIPAHVNKMITSSIDYDFQLFVPDTDYTSQIFQFRYVPDRQMFKRQREDDLLNDVDTFAEVKKVEHIALAKRNKKIKTNNCKIETNNYNVTTKLEKVEKVEEFNHINQFVFINNDSVNDTIDYSASAADQSCLPTLLNTESFIDIQASASIFTNNMMINMEQNFNQTNEMMKNNRDTLDSGYSTQSSFYTPYDSNMQTSNDPISDPLHSQISTSDFTWLLENHQGLDNALQTDVQQTDFESFFGNLNKTLDHFQ